MYANITSLNVLYMSLNTKQQSNDDTVWLLTDQSPDDTAYSLTNHAAVIGARASVPNSPSKCFTYTSQCSPVEKKKYI